MPTSAERPSAEGFPQTSTDLEDRDIRAERERLGLDPERLPLAGRTVLLTRSPDRAQVMNHALKVHGAWPALLPLIDFEAVTDPSAVVDAVDRAIAGEYDWLVVSSITTVRALVQYAGTERWKALTEAPVQVATIGPTSRAILERLGLTVALAPEDRQSAEGLLALWTGQGHRILLPQADIAGTVLSEGLRAAGNTVDTITAYHTVDAPARPERRLTVELGRSVTGAPSVSSFAILSPEQARQADAHGRLDAVVAASPSAARAVVERLGDALQARFVAIGPSTAAEAERLGLTVAAVAATPTPQGIVDAVIAALDD
ncbi:uroporphyrinogen-III synthase [Arthrobacter sp. Y-9]|uniref:uroporphyrinogen-III synthase n=1 Tax=Arthrobacter sp. Y-9 TaxID=3039385 RepID=UPI00241F58B5|nr:uroporphyrinogen-III synthase [Arthrobacter sp. Y-9]WFR83158.1 uroporphyrinogen-III synthase [Arthrobacter sp. Y-9]